MTQNILNDLHILQANIQVPKNYCWKQWNQYM